MKPALILLLILFSCKGDLKQRATAPAVKDTVNHDYNEPQGKNHKSMPTVDPTDNTEIEIKRPAKSTINTTLDTNLLFKIWTLDPNGPNADFEISAKSFYLADYDGDGDRPYTLEGNKLTVYYDDMTEKGTITLLTKDTLKIRWEHLDADMTYVLFPQ
ncbi:MAG: hypothetical protein V4581_07400 [Bacteroidota bacterium]